VTYSFVTCLCLTESFPEFSGTLIDKSTNVKFNFHSSGAPSILPHLHKCFHCIFLINTEKKNTCGKNSSLHALSAHASMNLEFALQSIICVRQETNSQTLRVLLIISCLPMETRIRKKSHWLSLALSAHASMNLEFASQSIICVRQETNSQTLRVLLIISCLPMETRICKKSHWQINLPWLFLHIRLPQIILISLKTVVHDELL